MGGLKRYYNDLVIRKKLVLLFSIVIIPVMVGALCLTNRMKKTDFRQSNIEVKTEIQRVKNRLEEVTELSKTLQNSIISDFKVKEVLLKEGQDTLSTVEDYRITQVFRIYEEMYKAIDDARVYGNNETLLNNMDFMRVTPEIQNAPWYQNAIKASPEMNGGYCYDAIKNKNFYMITRHFKPSKEKDAVIMILIDLSFLNSLVKEEIHDILILDSKDYIIASKNPEEVGQNLYYLQKIHTKDKPNMWQENYNGVKSQLILESIQVEKLDIKILGAIPIEEILKPANEARKFGLMVIFLSSGAALYFAWIFANMVTNQVHKLKKDMNQVAKGDFNQLSLIEGNDEFGELSRNLGKMVDSLKTLMDENIEMQQKEQQLLLYQEQMKFAVLANQVNPHFLFNVLEAIRMKAYLQGEKELASIVQLLGVLIRRNLEMTDKEISIGEELDFVQNYLTVQEFRFGDKIRTSIEDPKGLGHYKILPLTIQPIVENAIIHGLEKSLEPGQVFLEVAEIKDKIRIKIRDNGVGIPEDRLKQLKENLSQSSKGEKVRIGMRNIHQRIQIQYGEEYGVNIESEQGRGTCVTIMIPKIVGESNDESINY